ncbi:MAG: hypothetical protein ACJ8F7_20975 [Gemmataceae bacterium]
MNRTACVGVAAFLLLAGCQNQPDQLRVPSAPADGQLLSYRDTVAKARTLATSAVEAFYVDNWTDVEAAATNLEKTAQFLPKAIDVPAARQSTLDAQSQALQQDAQKLRESAHQADVKKTNEVLQRIHLQVRELKPD